jgi:decaprenylphospho-beta-D-erythro-pentofuranosid-2-ulose 2-reductase
VIDGLGSVQSVVLIGGTSEIGIATLHEMGKRKRLQRIVLCGRQSENLQRTAEILAADFVNAKIELVPLDLINSGTLSLVVEEIFDAGRIDVVVLAAGVLPDAIRAMDDAEYAVASAKVNFLGPLEIGTAALSRFRKQGHGTLVVMSSVAAERPRKDNYVYGSAKSGIDAWANGAADAISGTAVRVLVVRPGMVRTRMSAGIPEAPLTSNPDDVAKVIAKRLSRGPVTVWVPGKLRWLMFVLRHLPRPIFRKISRGGKG